MNDGNWNLPWEQPYGFFQLFPSGILRPTTFVESALRTEHFNSHLSLAQVRYVLQIQAHPG